MNGLEEKYKTLLEEARENPDILGLIWGGSRGKSEKFVTKDSDYDVIVVISDNASDTLKARLRNYESKGFEVWVRTMAEFKRYAGWGSKEEWDRYNFSHNTAVVDKIGEIQKIIDEKGNLPENVRGEVIEESLDNYINLVYRSAKQLRDGDAFASHIDATESLPPLMTALYALEGRLRPYNKYFEWELNNYPLRLLPWPVEEFVSDYKTILKTGNIKTQEKISIAVKKLFLEQGFSKSVNAWKGLYFVG